MTVAVTSQDLQRLVIMVVIPAVAGLGIFGAVRAKLVFVKIGLLLAALSVGVGLAHYGWEPLFGGTQPRALFGATMLFVGLLASATLGAVEESHRKMTSGAEPTRGFPVISSPPRPSA